MALSAAQDRMLKSIVDGKWPLGSTKTFAALQRLGMLTMGGKLTEAALGYAAGKNWIK